MKIQPMLLAGSAVGFFCFVFQLGEFSDWIDIGIGHSNVSEHSWC